MSTSMQRRRRPAVVLAVLLGGALPIAACAADAPATARPDQAADTTAAAPPLPMSPMDTVAMMDTLVAVAAETPPSPAAEVRVPKPMQAAPSMIEMRRRRAVAQLVQGVAELQIDKLQVVPAEYFRAVLRGPADVRPFPFTRDAITSATGEFFFKDVPADVYELAILTVTKEERQVYVTRVSIAAGELVRLPPIHIPIESVKVRR